VHIEAHVWASEAKGGAPLETEGPRETSPCKESNRCSSLLRPVMVINHKEEAKDGGDLRTDWSIRTLCIDTKLEELYLHTKPFIILIIISMSVIRFHCKVTQTYLNMENPSENVRDQNIA
jgi:hypothetical protein